MSRAVRILSKSERRVIQERVPLPQYRTRWLRDAIGYNELAISDSLADPSTSCARILQKQTSSNTKLHRRCRHG